MNEMKTFLHYFKRQVRMTPNRIALNDCNHAELTYTRTDEYSNIVADSLIKKGAEKGDIVAVLLERTVYFPVVCIGIFKCGAAYMPIDDKYPAERISYMLEDSKSKVLITTRALLHMAGNFTGEIIFMEDMETEFTAGTQKMRTIEIISCEQDIAYVIYTSGTTGKPKGSLNNHRSLVNLFRYSIAEYEITENDISGVYLSLAFDASVFAIFTFLTCGACVDIFPDKILLDMPKLEQYISEHGVTFAALPAAVAKLYDAEAGKNSLRLVMGGGDVLSVKPSDKYKLYNGYGPTETCIMTASFFVDKEYDHIPIGKPVANTYFYLAEEDADGNLSLVPDGEAGELYIAGVCVGNGYLNRDELTKERFIKNKFSDDGSQPVLYKTGDLCKRLPDGNYLYIGRTDSQIKLHGYRIELGEIEALMRNFPGVKDAVCASFSGESGEKYICGYYSSENVLDEAAIRDFLLLKLPKYMLPVGFSKIAEIPLSANGKYKRDALKPIERKIDADKTRQAQIQSEKALLCCIESVLQIAPPSLLQSFAEIGGDSFSAISLISELRGLGYSATAADILNNDYTLAHIAALLVEWKQTQKSKVSEITYDLTSTQRGMLYYYLMNPKTVEYIDQALYKVDGKFDMSVCKKAFSLLGEKYPVLKTAILCSNVSNPMQTIIPDREMEIKGIVLKNESLDKALERDLNRGFDFENDSLIRITVLKESDEFHYLLVSFAHIILDGWSMSILMKDFIVFYEKLASGAANKALMAEAKEWALNNASFQDFISALKDADFAGGEAYYGDMLANYETDASIQKDFKSGKKVYAEKITGLSTHVTGGVQRIAKSCMVTPAAVYEAVYALMLQKYCGSADVVFGKTVFGRNYAMDGIASMAGLFINTLPARVTEEENDRFVDFFTRVQNRINAERKYDFCDLSEIQKKTSQRDALLQTLFSYNKFPEIYNKSEKGSFNLTFCKEIQKTHFNFGFIINSDKNFAIQYNSAVYSENTINDFAAGYIYLLEQAISDVNLKLSQAQTVTQEQKEKLFELLKGAVENEWKNKTYTELFAEQVAKTPEQMAIKDCYGHELTYVQLDAVTNWLASQIGDLSGEKKSVGIMTDRSVLFPIAAIAIFKSGRAYLPINSEYPEETLRYMIEDSDLDLILTCDNLNQAASGFCSNTLNISNWNKYMAENASFEYKGSPDDLAYIIYTSGTTGKPKGTMLSVKNLVNHCRWSIHYCGENLITAATSEFSFDASVEQIYPKLISGGTVIIVNQETRDDLVALESLVEREAVNCLQVSTVIAKLFIESYSGNSVKDLYAAGEKLTLDKVPQNYRLHNLYGPTEYTVWASGFLVDRVYDNIPIGKIVMNTHGYILDENLRILPQGALGQLCLSGRQMSYGYLNNPELTAKSFVKNPYAVNDETKILYKTGDLVRLLPDGNIEYHGRIDNQVKIRGFRIELGEIEVAINTHPDISQTVCVAAKAGENNSFICCYYVSEKEISNEVLTAYGMSKMAKHMVPSVFIRLDKIPLTQSGKIDKRALPKAEYKTAAEYEAPVNDIEKKLEEVYCAALQINRFSRGENFFAMGGTSLHAISATAKLKAFYDVSINKIYEFPVLKNLAAELAKQEKQPKPILKRDMNYSEAEARSLDKAEAEKEKYLGSIEQLKPIDTKKRADYKTVLLSGATGYLGVYILKELTDNYDVKIIAVVRGENDEAAGKRVLEKSAYYFGQQAMSSKVEVLSGDLGERGFGLSTDDYKRLINQVDLVINAAANVKHFGHHAEFEKANVTAVENLIEFCRQGRKKHFAQTSTISVAAGNIENVTHAVFTEDTVDIGQNCDNYYISTKLTAEKMTIAAREQGLSTSIFRLGNITIDTERHKLQSNITENAFFKILEGFVNISAISRELAETELSFVDQCADAICRLAFCPATQNGIYHIQNHNTTDIAKILTEDLELAIELKDKQSFVDFLSENLARNDIGGYIESLMTHLDALDSSVTTQTEILSEKTRHRLQQLGFTWKQADAKLINELVKRSLNPRVSFIKSVPCFSRLSEESLFGLAGLLVNETYEENSFVRHENKKYSRLLLIKEGMGELFMTSQSGWEGTVEIVKKGDLFGIEALTDKKASATLEAVFDDIEIYSIEAKRLNALFAKHPGVATAFIGFLNDKLTKNQKFWVNVK